MGFEFERIFDAYSSICSDKIVTDIEETGPAS